jgi:ferritin-like metal-binding protein YciE
MTQEVLKELFIEQLQDVYDAEKQLVKALPKVAKAAQSEELSKALNNHLQETQKQVQRLEEIFQLTETNAKSKPCKGMKGLLEEGDEATHEQEGMLRDLAIIAGCQRVEHYEIAAYGTMRALAERLELSDAIKLLEQTAKEERAADQKLTDVAMAIYGSAAGNGEKERAMAASARHSQGSAKLSSGKTRH